MRGLAFFIFKGDAMTFFKLYVAPTLIRWIVGLLIWLGVHWGIKELTPEAAGLAANAIVNAIAPYTIAGYSAVRSWLEKRALHLTLPPGATTSWTKTVATVTTIPPSDGQSGATVVSFVGPSNPHLGGQS